MKTLSLLSIFVLLTSLALTACSGEPPSEKTALNRCQSIAREAMPEFVGNPRFRQGKKKVDVLQSGPQLFEFQIYGEYFFKAFNSGDSELRFDCTISKGQDDEEWTTVAFESICVGGCY